MADTATLKSPKPQFSTDSAAAPASAPIVAFAMLSHRGHVRHANQDCCAAQPEHGAFVVCDGMGGAAGGEVASTLAMQTFLDCLTHRDPPPHDAAEPGVQLHPRVRLAEAVRTANQIVFQRSLKSPSLHGMGTTLVALLLEEASTPRAESQQAGPTSPLWLAHVGDSRCYLFRSGYLRQLTHDHSLVEEQVRAGMINRAQAAASPLRSIITRAVGTQPTVDAEISCHILQPGDLYLLASDGLTRELDDDMIAHVLTHTANPAESGTALQAVLHAACHALVDIANEHGGRDNITVLLVACARG